MKHDLTQYDGVGLKQLIDQREVTPCEVRQYFAERMKKLNPTLNAVVHTIPEAIDETESAVDGPLSGLPFLIKDLNPVKGHPLTNGSALLDGFTAPEDDLFVKRYRKAGLHILGKTNTPEFGFTPVTEPQLFGATYNPWDLTRSPSGSSGGAAAAVASGMVPFAHASDGGGSIRMPASMNGLFGFKPSRGRTAMSPYINQISVNHALTRSVRDSAALLDVIQGGTQADVYPTLPIEQSFLQQLDQYHKPLTIGVSLDWGGQVPVDTDTREAFNEAVKLLTDLGHHVHMIDPPLDFADFTEQFMNVWIASGAVAIDHVGAMVGKTPSEKTLEPLTHEIYEAGQQMDAFTYESSRVRMQVISQQMMQLHDTFDVIVTPVFNQKTFKTGELNPQSIADMTTIMMKHCSFTQLANASGQPAMSVPIYWSNDQLPIGIQFQAGLGHDALLFQLAHQIESAKPWFYRYQQLESSLQSII
ncbi:amidase [Alkalibacillus flavidus]|uniref:Amidase n=1 Tax=Alkalibacillus flavidus TaxID=546021 RepID=A0ABV2KWW4_9BACI